MQITPRLTPCRSRRQDAGWRLQVKADEQQASGEEYQAGESAHQHSAAARASFNSGLTITRYRFAPGTGFSKSTVVAMSIAATIILSLGGDTQPTRGLYGRSQRSTSYLSIRPVTVKCTGPGQLVSRP